MLQCQPSAKILIFPGPPPLTQEWDCSLPGPSAEFSPVEKVSKNVQKLDVRTFELRHFLLIVFPPLFHRFYLTPNPAEN